MNTKSKLTLIAAIIAVGLGAPAAAMAQSAWTTGTAANRVAAGFTSSYGRANGLNAFAMIQEQGGRGSFGMLPQTDGHGIARSPAAQGGGSLGYNEGLAIH
jgi:hypothetical protein